MVRYFFPAFAVFVVLAHTPVSAQSVPPYTDRIGRAAEFYHHQDGFTGVVAEARAGQVVFQKGYGYADFARQAPFVPDDRFRIGSLSKQFTAVAVLLLQQAGKLKTSDLVSRYYPNTPAAWSSITLRNLLTQTSGIPDVDFGLVLKDSPHTPEELMQGISGKALEFRPSSKFEYANVNYMILGRVIEKAAGEPYCLFLQEHIFRPLQLHETGCDWNTVRVAQRAHGYRPSAHGPVAVEDDDLSSLAGAGNLYSSAADLIRWTEALHGGKVLSRASLAEMTTPFLNGYAYGLEIGSDDGSLDISHNGMVDGFFSCLDYIPRTETTIVVLSNLVGDGNHSSPGTLALDTELVRLAIGEDAILPSEGREASVQPAILNSYTGRYRSENPHNPQILVLSLVDGHLFIHDEGVNSPPERVMAETSTSFYLDHPQDIDLTFDPQVPGSLQIFDFSAISGNTFLRIPQSALNIPDHKAQ